MAKLTDVNHLLSEIKKLTQWLRSNANISKALSATEGAVKFREGVISRLHDLNQKIDQVLLSWKHEKSTENPELVELGRQSKDEINNYEFSLLDSQVNAARAFHKAYSDLHNALLRVDTFSRFITNLIRIQSSPSLSDKGLSIIPPDVDTKPTSDILPPSDIMTSKLEEKPKYDFEIPTSPLGRLLEETQKTSRATVSSVPPGRLSPQKETKPENNRLEQLQEIFPFDLSKGKQTPELTTSSQTKLKQSELISGQELIQEIKQLKTDIQSLQDEREKLQTQAMSIHGVKVNRGDIESELIKAKSDVSRLKNHIQVLEEQNKKLSNEILRYQDILSQFRSQKEPDFQNIMKENLSLVNQLTQIRRQRIEIRFEELENELNELRRILKK